MKRNEMPQKGPSLGVADPREERAAKGVIGAKSRSATTGQRKKAPERRPEDEFSDRFYGLLGRLVHAHAGLDFNVGLQLRYIAGYLGQDVESLLLATTPFARRLTKLHELTIELFAEASGDVLRELTRWFEEAERLKHVRNDFVHGRWGVPRSFAEWPRRIEFAPLHWDMNSETAPKPMVMNIEDLEQEVGTLQRLAGEFFSLAHRYESWPASKKSPGKTT